LLFITKTETALVVKPRYSPLLYYLPLVVKNFANNFQVLKLFFLCCIFFLIGFCSLDSYSQHTYNLDRTTRFERIGVEQGLSSEYCYCIHQDKYGFIWIGTQYGLNLYDGYEIKVFNVEFQNPRSILDQSIRCIFEEPDGTMWFGTGTGISKFDRSTDSFTNYLPDTSRVSNRHNSILKILPYEDKFWVSVNDGLFLFDKKTGLFSSYTGDSLNPFKSNYFRAYNNILVDNSNNLWFGSSSKDGKYALSKYDKNTDKIIHFLNDPQDSESFNGKEVMEIIEDRYGTIWAATYGGGLLEITDSEHGKFEQLDYQEYDHNSLPLNWLSTVFEDSKGNLWIGCVAGFAKFNKKTKQYTTYRVPNRSYNQFSENSIHRFYEDKNGILWLSSWDGVFRFNPKTENLQHFIHDLNRQNSLSGHIVIQVMQDRSGQIWILQYFEGINILNHLANAFIKTEKTINNPESLGNNHVLNIQGDSKGNLWVGTRTGLNRTVLNDTKEFTHFEHYVLDKNDLNSLSDNRISIIFEDTNQEIWIGTNWGLNKYDPENNNFVRYMPYKEEYRTGPGLNIITSVFEDSQGTFWISARGGMNILERSTETFIQLNEIEKNKQCNFNTYARTIYEDLKGDVWFGGGKLRKLSRQDTCILDFSLGETVQNDGYNIDVSCFGEDLLGDLWIGTSMGLFKLNRDDMSFTSLTLKNGLPSNGITAIETDGDGNLWVSTKNGISRINPTDFTIRNFDKGDGLVCLEFIRDCSYKDNDGWIYFGGRKGFNVFHPDSIKDNKHIPPVYISGLFIAGEQKFLEDAIYNLDYAELNYFENDFSFEFVALDYINPLKNQFAYMLEGYDNDWIDAGNKRTAFYTNMNPGEYVFRVKASNNHGYWNEKGDSIMLVINPPFWRTWWAYLIYFFAFVSAFYIFYRNELKRLNLKRKLEIEQLQKDKLVEIDKEKSNFFANVSHEFRTPLTLILGPINKVFSDIKDERFKNELGIAQRNVKRLQTLINQLLSLSKLEAGKMKLNAKEEDIVQLMKGFMQSFESLTKQKDIDLIFDSSLEKYLIRVDRLKVEKIMNNLLSNAVKFTNAKGEIKVSVSQVNRISDSRIKKVELKDSNYTDEEGVLIKISDTGIGIKEEDLDQVFNRFYQAERGHNRGYEGTGIGLALTKELVELHQGSISVESEENKGTIVSFFLPSNSHHIMGEELLDKGSDDQQEDNDLFIDDYIYGNIQGVENKKEDTYLKAEKGAPIILVVEDNPDMRSYLKNYLENSYHVIEADNGENGLKEAFNHIPDLILTDLMMPKMDGNELTKIVKTDQRTSHIPVIMLTAKYTLESKLEGLETGADDFITKPFDAQELLVRIKNLILQRKKLRDLLRQHINSPDQNKSICDYTAIGMTKLDEKFLEKVVKAIEKHLSDPDFCVESLSDQMAMSRKHLHRKLTSLIDHSPNMLIRDIRLRKAAELIKEGELNITQVTYEIGISSLSYFAKVFKEKFGVSPSDYY
jgi:signal transduction histidine kinase/ligand-binding sensor domain-containing protein/DNA-binding response OmpR family regulator